MTGIPYARVLPMPGQKMTALVRVMAKREWELLLTQP